MIIHTEVYPDVRDPSEEDIDTITSVLQEATDNTTNRWVTFSLLGDMGKYPIRSEYTHMIFDDYGVFLGDGVDGVLYRIKPEPLKYGRDGSPLVWTPNHKEYPTITLTLKENE